MKKIFVTALAALLMTAAFTGCGANEATDNNSTESDTVEVVDPKEIDLVPTQEILDADIESCKIQLGNDVILELPITLEKLMQMGATIPDDINPVNEILAQGRGTSIDVTINGNTYELGFDIFGDAYQLQLKDCSITGGDTGYFPFIMPKGIKVGSTVEDVKAAYGEPEREYLDSFSYNFTWDIGKKNSNGKDMQQRIHIAFYIDIEKHIVNKISFSVHEEEK